MQKLYAVTPPALQPAECGQCHVGQFANLKDSGGKHRFACQECHEVFHAYNPRKNNYDELMPLCTSCHGQQHGPKQTDCINCHQNPHAPLRVPAMERLGKCVCRLPRRSGKGAATSSRARTPSRTARAVTTRSTAISRTVRNATMAIMRTQPVAETACPATNVFMPRCESVSRVMSRCQNLQRLSRRSLWQVAEYARASTARSPASPVIRSMA